MIKINLLNSYKMAANPGGGSGNTSMSDDDEQKQIIKDFLKLA